MYKTLIQNPQKFQNLLSLAGSDVETSVEVGRKFVSVLYDPKDAAKSAHVNLNELRVKSALAKGASLVRLPASEAAFKQHILRASLQVYVWMNSHVAKPPPISPLKFGWAMADGSMKLVYLRVRCLRRSCRISSALVKEKMLVENHAFVQNKI